MTDSPFPEVAGVSKSLQRAISLGMRAGAFRIARRDFPQNADTFRRAADFNSAKAAEQLSAAIRELSFDCKDQEP